MTMQTRVFIVHMDPNMGTRLFAKAKEVGMTVDYVWIVTDGITTFLNSMDHSVLESMQGVIGIKPYVPETRQVKHFRGRWKKKFYQDHPEMMNVELNNYGLWAYDATTALARAVENIAGDLTNEEGIVSNISSTSTPDLERLGVFKSGRTLVHELSQTRLKGLSGDFVLKKGKQRDPTYQIVNIVNGDGERGIGFWSSHKDQLQLGTVIWPGDTTKKPKGFEIPINGKRLKIGVPVKHGFFEFVNATDKNDIKGYCIDIFEAAVKALPYALPFDYVQFPSWIYNDIVHDVFSMNLDGAVGDITIRLNRSLYVDFTLPYTESGVAMLVPVEDTGNKNNAWVFLGPLTWNLWVTTFLFFIFIGFVIWVLEHRINNDFRGPPSHQAGTSFWFSFSTMVFAHREKVVSNLTRIVMIVWCFVVLILTQSYTASLTSRLTVQKLRPTITNINDVLRNGDSVGYQEGSFLLDLLTGLGFPRNRLLPYKNLTECESLFSQRKIAAAVDEVSYVKIFLAKHCSNYAMIDQPAYKIDGFAFAFPKGSPLVVDISRAILNVTEGEGMLRIQEKWFGTESKCPDPSASVSSESEKLGLNSFWSLFVIAGVAAVSALFTFAATFVYEHRNSLTSSRDDSNPSLWGKILNLLKMFDNKDLGCHTFRNERDGEVNLVNLNNNVQQESPSTYSIQSALDLDHHSVPQTPSIPPLAVHDDDITVEVNHPHPSTDSVAATLHTTSPRVDLSK
ncbi:Glutamate receptor 2.7 [Linum perenne]